MVKGQVYTFLRSLIFIFLFFSALMSCRSNDQPSNHEVQASENVKIEGGFVKGIKSDGIKAFKGIPFAAPPIGNLRWKTSQFVIPLAR